MLTALVILHLSNAALAANIRFGLADFSEAPGGGWTLMSSTDFERYKTEFVSHYNANNGIAPILTFKSGNCCVAVKGGNKLMISNT